ncbi:MAG: MBL fold metallo-hydrolase [Thermoanaerobaculia bacterium]|nr:MBL fold metallo-hydrolase [Thermoanaerobaculia bacterium]
MAKATFCGACGCVTGSSTHLEWGESRILVDCGLYQGDDELEQRNWDPLPYAPHRLDAVVLTHAHLDHTGLLPRLVKEGFDGPIYCSRASRGLVSLILRDAGSIQEEQARYARKKGYSRHVDPQPLYTEKDARQVLKLLRPLPFDQEHEIRPGIRIRLRRAGHLLGAASIEMEAKDGDGRRRRWCFSGDVGRYGVPILKDPEPPLEPCETLVLESTYGDRSHRDTDPEAEFRKTIQRVYRRRGVVIIPAFALGRTQEVLFHLAALVRDGDLDPDTVFLDSPMAIAATEIYEHATSEHDEETADLVRRELSALDPDRFHRCKSVEQSKQLNHRDEPTVIVASSGMATGGRVVHHLKRRLSDPRNAVVFVGYQASGTRGRALIGGADRVGIHGEKIPVRAEILSIHGLSAHGDRETLLRWVEALPEPPKRIFLNHGEDPPRKALAAELKEVGLSPVALPLTGDTFPW